MLSLLCLTSMYIIIVMFDFDACYQCYVWSLLSLILVFSITDICGFSYQRYLLSDIDVPLVICLIHIINIF